MKNVSEFKTGNYYNSKIYKHHDKDGDGVVDEGEKIDCYSFNYTSRSVPNLRFKFKASDSHEQADEKQVIDELNKIFPGELKRFGTEVKSLIGLNFKALQGLYSSLRSLSCSDYSYYHNPSETLESLKNLFPKLKAAGLSVADGDQEAFVSRVDEVLAQGALELFNAQVRGLDEFHDPYEKMCDVLGYFDNIAKTNGSLDDNFVEAWRQNHKDDIEKLKMLGFINFVDAGQAYQNDLGGFATQFVAQTEKVKGLKIDDKLYKEAKEMGMHLETLLHGELERGISNEFAQSYGYRLNPTKFYESKKKQLTDFQEVLRTNYSVSADKLHDISKVDSVFYESVLAKLVAEVEQISYPDKSISYLEDILNKLKSAQDKVGPDADTTRSLKLIEIIQTQITLNEIKPSRYRYEPKKPYHNYSSVQMKDLLGRLQAIDVNQLQMQQLQDTWGTPRKFQLESLTAWYQQQLEAEIKELKSCIAQAEKREPQQAREEEFRKLRQENTPDFSSPDPVSQ